MTISLSCSLNCIGLVIGCLQVTGQPEVDPPAEEVGYAPVLPQAGTPPLCTLPALCPNVALPACENSLAGTSARQSFA